MMKELELLHVLAVGAGAEDAFLRLVQDAERYRWLRNQTWNSSLLAVVDNPRNSVKLGAIAHRTHCLTNALICQCWRIE